MKSDNEKEKPLHFIQQLITQDLAQGLHTEVITRFPPEPNGYLHVGHAKSICLNFGLAKQFGGKCYLRFDDTNPLKEEEEFVQAIIADVEWLGFQWCAVTYTSDYYQKLYDFAVILIEKDLAYVDSLSMDEIRAYRGTWQEPGKESPYRSRSKEGNLELLAAMKAGKFADGTHVLRAKIDMQAGNINLRDPVLYRIRHASHQRTGDAWCIYPMYDYAHPISDALEYITHSLCTLEFQDHRPLYDWFIENLPVPAKPVQTEFARLNLSHTVTSKRKLRELVEKKIVSGWDDPRMPTIKGMRRRGYPPEAIRQFCDVIGMSRSDSVIDMSILEECVRNVLNQTAPRLLCVQDPLKVVIENFPEEEVLSLSGKLMPSDPESETREIPFTREIYIERSDFMEEPSKQFFRLSPGMEVRLRFAYVIKCTQVIRNAEGKVVELRAELDPETLGKNPEGRKVKGVIHWVSATQAFPINILQYDRLFLDPNPGREEDFLQFINPHSLEVLHGYCEPAVAHLQLNAIVQFERLGYYAMNEQSSAGVITGCHRIVDLKDSWGKIETKHNLMLYNSLTRQKERSKPLKEGEIKMYVCGVTVYDRCHLGHGRSMVCFDVTVRFLRYLGFQVTYVRNITDIDDKIIVRAAERKIPIEKLTAEQIKYLHADTQALGILPPDSEPCATHVLPQIIALIERLIAQGYAYVTPQGNVCFEVEKLRNYGQLSQQDLAKLLAGSRIEIDIEKKSPLDFVLWKKAKPQEPAWPSPWGEGRPGWHIECSAMSMDQLGEEFDIHGGGLDLQFPHHENEIAQSEAATGHTYARYWVHVGMLQVNDTKMSKSLGNFFTIEDVLKNHHPEVVRFFLLSSHYRSQLNYSAENLRGSAKALMRLYQALRGFECKEGDELDHLWVQRFEEAMADDFNTPIALAVLFDLSHALNKQPSQRLATTLKHLGGILGILQHPVEAFLQAIVTTEDDEPQQIAAKITARNQAREDKNWARADAIRQELLEKGIELEDTKTGTVWRKILK